MHVLRCSLRNLCVFFECVQDCDHTVIGALAVVADVNRCEFDTHGNNTTESPVMINMHQFVDS